MITFGSHWISGCVNHDTLRRGSQVDPAERINTYLGDSLPEIIEQAYANLLTYGLLPGVPMDFLNALAHAVEVTHYDLDAVVPLLDAMEPPLAGPPRTLKQIARDWMDDVHDYCNVAHPTDGLNPEQTAFNRSVRAFRKARPWLRDDFSDEDTLRYRAPTNGTVLFYGLRRAPDDSEQILFVGNMEGAPVTVSPFQMPIRGLSGDE